MSSPIYHPKDLDPALMYAPPWARDPAQPAPSSRAAPPVEWPPQRRRLHDGRNFSGDRAVLEVKRQLTLDPDMVPQPPAVENDRPASRLALVICGAAGLAALAAWGIVSLPGARLFEHKAVQTRSAAASILTTATDAESSPRATATHVAMRNEIATRNEPETAVLAQARPGASPAQPAAVAAPPVAPAPVTPAPPEHNPLRLDNREIATLVMRGENFIANGDIASARLLLQRAADAGSANAALALAATFDPLVTSSLGVTAGEPDVARARKWYQRAIELGSTAASQQLAKLVETRQ